MKFKISEQKYTETFEIFPVYKMPISIKNLTA